MVEETVYISDCQEKLQSEIEGHFNPLQTSSGVRTCFVSSDFDVMTIGELINACGYTTESVHGRRVEITITEID
jgi:hypothetical protein